MSAEDGQAQQDLAVVVQDLLNQMQTSFQATSNNIVQRIDEMGTRIDALEKAIGNLVAQAGLEEESEKRVAGASASSGEGSAPAS